MGWLLLRCREGRSTPAVSSLFLVTMTHQYDSSRIGTDEAPQQYPLEVDKTKLIATLVLHPHSCYRYSAYCPSKYALRGLADCLRNELKRDGIRITIFFPSTLDTPGLENERKTLPAETAEIEGSSADLFSPDMAASDNSSHPPFFFSVGEGVVHSRTLVGGRTRYHHHCTSVLE